MWNTEKTNRFGWLIAIAFTALLASDALAAPPDGTSSSAAVSKRGVSEATVPSAPDMRLWSFGACDTRFPFIDSPEHRECVRVVSSQEAKDVRAYHYCTASYGSPDDVERCKAAYDANKARLARGGAAAPAESQDVSPEIMRQVKAITSAAVDVQSKAPVESAALVAAAVATGGKARVEAVAAEVPESFWSPTVLVFGVAFIVALGAAAMVARRRQAAVLE